MPRIRRSMHPAACLSALLATAFLAGCDHDPASRDMVSAAADTAAPHLQITYPAEGTLFPPDSVAPTFAWKDGTSGVDRWYGTVRDGGGADLLTASVDAPRWRPTEEEWRRIKASSNERDADVVVAGVQHTKRAAVRSAARVRIRTSKDPVADALFYREVPLPFLTAVQDPSRIRWRYGTIDMEGGPPIVLQNLPVCGNCHSFADNGSVLGLDVD